jgi:hypothetical protein
MKIVGTRFLRGLNVHETQPCHVAVLDLQALDGVVPSSLPALRDALADELGDDAASLGEAPDMAELVARLVWSLQAIAGTPVPIGLATRAASAPPRQWRVISGYRLEAVVERAVAVAVGWVDAIARDEPFDAAGAILDLRRRVQDRAIDAASESLLKAARARGIPVLRLDEDARVFQLGWGVRQHRFEAAAPGDTALMPAAALDHWFGPGDDGRIPIVAITGTNGKTTTTLLIAHAVRMSGACTGTTTTQGVFLDGRGIEVGDCTGYWSARRVLTHEAVEVATLETARGGLLKRGLAFDRCDVGVVLNVSADHLGLDGVETLSDLAEVKGLVARCATSAAVLNAEDEFCVGMRASLPCCASTSTAAVPPPSSRTAGSPGARPG